MKDINVLRRERAEALDQCDKIVNAAANDNNRAFTDEERQNYDNFWKAFERVDDQIKRIEQIQRARAEESQAIDRAEDPEARKMNRTILRRKGIIRGYGRGVDAARQAYAAGQYVRALIMGREKAPQAWEWCANNGMGLEKVMSEAVNTSGGFLVPAEMEGPINDLREVYGVARRLARVRSMSTERLVVPIRRSGLTMVPMNETSGATASDKSWGQVELNARIWGVICRYSNDLSEDAIIDLAADLADEIAYAAAVAEDTAFFDGDGTSTYAGIRGIRSKIIDGTHTAGAIDAASGHDTFAELDATDLVTLMSKCPEYAKRGASWVCSPTAWELVFTRLLAAAGGNTIETLRNGVPARSYLGYPVEVTPAMPSATTDISDTVMLFFGDMRMSTLLGDRRMITIQQSEHRYFEYNQTAILGTERFDINHHSLGDNTTAGPVVALVAE